MRVLVTGATGLLGGATVEELLAPVKHEVRCMVREDSPNASRLDRERVEVVAGDCEDSKSVEGALRETDALVHIAGIEYAPQVLDAARRAGVERVVMVSSTSVHSSHDFRSGPKRRMEALVRESGLRWSIVRPTMIYGSERDKNIHRLLRFLDVSPVFPMFGSGENLWQPVYFEDCARGLRAALERSAAVRQSYDLPGAAPLAYNDLVRFAAAALGKEPRIVLVPLEPVRRTLHIAESLHLPLPISSEQVLRLREDKAYPYDKAGRELDYTPRPFAEGIALEVARLREIGMLRS